MRFEEDIRYFINKIRDKIYYKTTKKLVKDIKKVLLNYHDDIPVFLISYNNAIYVKNSVEQLKKYNIKPIILDNNTTDKASLKLLKELEKDQKAYVVYSERNFGHMIGFLNPVFEVMPEVFAYSDPDLEFNKNLPQDFLKTLDELTKRYKVFKAGFALELLDEEMISVNITRKYGVPKAYTKELTIKEWEEQFWRMKLYHERLEVYQAPLDTTFAVYRKSNLLEDFFDGVRVAGDFSAIHLPWYPKRDLLSKEQKEVYLKDNKSSTWVNIDE